MLIHSGITQESPKNHPSLTYACQHEIQRLLYVLETDLQSDHTRPHSGVTETVVGSEFRIPEFERREIEEIVARNKDTEILCVHLLQSRFGQCVAEFDTLETQEGHVLFPPCGRHIVVGVGGFAQARPEHILRGVLLRPAVVVVGKDVAEHALPRSGDEIGVAVLRKASSRLSSS